MFGAASRRIWRSDGESERIRWVTEPITSFFAKSKRISIAICRTSNGCERAPDVCVGKSTCAPADPQRNVDARTGRRSVRKSAETWIMRECRERKEGAPGQFVDIHESSLRA